MCFTMLVRRTWVDASLAAMIGPEESECGAGASNTEGCPHSVGHLPARASTLFLTEQRRRGGWRQCTSHGRISARLLLCNNGLARPNQLAQNSPALEDYSLDQLV